MNDTADFTVALKMARKTGSLADEVEYRTFTVTGPARNAKHAEAIAYGLGHGINEATGYAWKFCGGPDGVTVTPADGTDVRAERDLAHDLLDGIARTLGLDLDNAHVHHEILGKVNELTAELADVREHLNIDRQAVITLRQREQDALAALTEARTQAAIRTNEVGRLVAENARVRQQRDEAREHLNLDRQAIATLRQQRDAYTAVVEAAKAWRKAYGDKAANRAGNSATALVAAVDALPTAEATAGNPAPRHESDCACWDTAIESCALPAATR